MKRIRVSFIFISFILFSTSIYGQLWKLYADSASFYTEQGNDTMAIKYFMRAKNLLSKDSINTNIYIEICKHIGDSYYSKSFYNNAEPFYKEARTIYGRLYGKDVNYANKTDSLGILNVFNGDYKDALHYFLEAKEIKEKLFRKQSAQYAISCNSLGNIYSEIGKYKESEIFLKEAKDIREKLYTKQSTSYAQSCNNLAFFYWQTGQYEKAEPLAIEARQLRGKLLKQPHADYAISCTNLGNIYRDMGQYKKAEALYIEAKDVREKKFSKEHALYAASCNILADLYDYMQEYANAEKLYLEAKEIREKIFTKQSSIYAQTCNNLSGLYKDMGLYEKAESLALEAKEIWDSVLDKDHPSHAINLNNLGEIYFAMANYNKAKNYFIQARKLWAKQLGKKHPYYIENAANLAKVFWNLNEPREANEFYEEAFNSRFNQINTIFQFTNEKEKQLYLKNAIGSGDEYQSFYYKEFSHQSAGPSYTISLLNRSLILSSSQQMRQIIFKSHDSILNKKYNAWIRLKEQIANLYSTASDQNLLPIKETEEKADNIEKELSRRSTAFKKLQKKVSWQSIQQILKPNEAAIEFVDFRYFTGRRWTDSTYYIALLLRKDQQYPKLIKLFEKKQLDSLLTGAGNENIASVYTRGVSVNYKKNETQTAYNLIWKPLESSLTGIKKIYFAPAGNLFKISFAALPVDSNKTLSDKYRLIQLNSTAEITDTTKDFITTSDKLQLYGGIEYNADTSALKAIAVTYKTGSESARSLPADLKRSGSIQYLPGTEKEIEEIKAEAHKSNISVNALSGVEATEESFKALNGKASSSILHVATHGFFFPDPKQTDSTQENFQTTAKAFKQSDNPLFRSGLLFAGANYAWAGKPIEGIEDGILTAYEVSNMYLPNTKLVVLSACETALGDIEGSEGVYGLQRAFKIAGVKNLVMSLWKVPDQATAEFMQTFYKNLFAKQSISDAFYHAQTAMKNKYRNDPYKWAAWVLIR